VWIHDFVAESQDGAAIDVGRVRASFHEAFSRVWYGDMEDDGFNRLVLGAGLTWREVTVLRAYGKFLRQARLSLSQEGLEGTFSTYPAIARGIVALFKARFDPALSGDREAAIDGIAGELDRLLDGVANLEE